MQDFYHEQYQPGLQPISPIPNLKTRAADPGIQSSGPLFILCPWLDPQPNSSEMGSLVRFWDPFLLNAAPVQPTVLRYTLEYSGIL